MSSEDLFFWILFSCYFHRASLCNFMSHLFLHSLSWVVRNSNLWLSNDYHETQVMNIVEVCCCWSLGCNNVAYLIILARYADEYIYGSEIILYEVLPINYNTLINNLGQFTSVYTLKRQTVASRLLKLFFFMVRLQPMRRQAESF